VYADEKARLQERRRLAASQQEEQPHVLQQQQHEEQWLEQQQQQHEQLPKQEQQPQQNGQQGQQQPAKFPPLQLASSDIVQHTDVEVGTAGRTGNGCVCQNGAPPASCEPNVDMPCPQHYMSSQQSESCLLECKHPNFTPTNKSVVHVVARLLILSYPAACCMMSTAAMCGCRLYRYR